MCTYFNRKMPFFRQNQWDCLLASSIHCYGPVSVNTSGLVWRFTNPCTLFLQAVSTAIVPYISPAYQPVYIKVLAV